LRAAAIDRDTSSTVDPASAAPASVAGRAGPSFGRSATAPTASNATASPRMITNLRMSHAPQPLRMHLFRESSAPVRERMGPISNVGTRCATFPRSGRPAPPTAAKGAVDGALGAAHDRDGSPMDKLRRPTRRRVMAAALAVAVTGTGLATLGPGTGYSSSHREAPLVSGEPRLDNTDVYAFVSPDATDSVTLIASWIPLEEPNGGPNFYAWATDTAYDINIDSDGDAKPDIIYRWTFKDTYRDKNTFLYNTDVVTSLDDKDLNFRQFYDLERITPNGTTKLLDDAPAAPSFTGPASFPNYGAVNDAAITPLRGGGKSFAGQSDDPFFLDLRIFDLFYGKNFSEVGQDTLKGYNVNTIALQVPKKEVALKGDASRNPVIGVWSTTSRQRIEVVLPDNKRLLSGGYQQVSRLGMPLVNEVVIPLGRKDEFNATKPQDDGKFVEFVRKPEVPKRIEDIYWIPAPKTPRDDLVEVFLNGICKVCGPVMLDLNSQRINKDVDPAKFKASEQLRLNMSIPPTANPDRLGVLKKDLQGFPNGRRLADDTLDITVQAAEGVLLPGHPAAVDGISDGVDTNDVPFRRVFPYVALPNKVAVNQS
jgi:hypothetical protein